MSQQPEIRENIELEALNTLHVPAKARFYVEVHTSDELVRSLDWASSEDQEVLILGGGSNLVFAGDFAGLVVRLSRILVPMVSSSAIAWNPSPHWIAIRVSWLFSITPSAVFPTATACSNRRRVAM